MLFTAQLLMAVIHSIKQSYVTLVGVFLSFIPTVLAHKHFKRWLAPKLDRLALLRSARASSPNRSVRASTAVDEMRLAELSRLYQPQLRSAKVSNRHSSAVSNQHSSEVGASGGAGAGEGADGGGVGVGSAVRWAGLQGGDVAEGEAMDEQEEILELFHSLYFQAELTLPSGISQSLGGLSLDEEPLGEASLEYLTLAMAPAAEGREAEGEVPTREKRRTPIPA